MITGRNVAYSCHAILMLVCFLNLYLPAGGVIVDQEISLDSPDSEKGRMRAPAQERQTVAQTTVQWALRARVRIP